MIVKDLINNALKELGIEVSSVEIEVPREEGHGDISTPVAMVLASKLKKAPRAIAEDIAGAIGNDPSFEKIEVAGPGFINFFLSGTYLHNELSAFIKDADGYVKRDVGRGEKVQIEFVSANPTGPLHLGHGRGAVVGSVLANMLTAAGYNVEKEFYVNDSGRQVRLLGESVYARYLELCNKEIKFPDDGYKGEYVSDIANNIFDKEGKKYCDIPFDECSDNFIDHSYKLMLEEIERDLKEFSVFFDSFQSERDIFSEGHVDGLIDLLKKKDLVYEDEGATWFRSTEFGDDKDRVIIKSDGQYTYFASDIAYHYLKAQKGFGELINIWGADHHGYVKRVRSAIKAVGFDPGHLKVILVQMVSLLRSGEPVQMSKRAGNFVTLREVMDEIGVDTTRFIFLTRKPDSHLEFDLEEAKKQSSENPVFYVQYAFARINSIFRKASDEGFNVNSQDDSVINRLTEPEELRLIKKILYYPMMFEGAVFAREPHRITYYLQELAGLFHPYYNSHRVLTDDRDLSLARLALCRAVMLVLERGLAILGITSPERM
ncbi:MAG: arginine--tRNA ligase [Nitrospirota bacterium]|nr:MAG: arginine--tRNA ligase [Nitrospirota bacterium]